MLNDSLKHAKALFEQAGLALPPMPRALVPQVRELRPWVYGTRDPGRSLYDYRWFDEEARSAHPEDSLLFGHAGHGINSYAMHYYLIYGSLRVCLQVLWGGVITNDADDAARVCKYFEELTPVVAAADRSYPGQSGGPHISISISDLTGYGHWRVRYLEGSEPTLRWMSLLAPEIVRALDDNANKL